MLESLVEWYFTKNLDKNYMVKIISLCLFVLPFLGFSQIKGKAKHLVGKWNYKEGSGFEVWNRNGDKLDGSGYRILKFGDSVKVETLSLTFTNGRYTYTYYTTEGSTQVKDIHFISNGRKLQFVSTNSETPIRMEYRFNLRKNKMKLFVTVGEMNNRGVLTLFKEK